MPASKFLLAVGVDLEKPLCNHFFDSFLKCEQNYTWLLTKYANMQFPQVFPHSYFLYPVCWNFSLIQNMDVMGQNFVNILGLNEDTRRNQNWELDRLQNLQVFSSLAHKILIWFSVLTGCPSLRRPTSSVWYALLVPKHKLRHANEWRQICVKGSSRGALQHLGMIQFFYLN